jgi:outer membrane protein insertion porin family
MLLIFAGGCLWAIHPAAGLSQESSEPPTLVAAVEYSGDVPASPWQPPSRAAALIGAPYSPYAVRKVVEDLYGSGLFAQVYASRADVEDGVRVVFRLVAKTYVSEVNLLGNDAVPASALQQGLRLRPGSEYAAELLEGDTAHLEASYRERGFLQASVQSSATTVGRSAVVSHLITEGRQAQFGRLELRGVRPTFERPLREAIGQRPGRPYSAAALAEVQSRAQAFYTSWRFLAAQVAAPVAAYRAEDDRVDVALSVNEGKRVDVFFAGNRHYGADVLGKAVALDRLNDLSLQRARTDLQRFYRRNGYPQASVLVPTVEETDQAHRVTFAVEEGPRQFLREVRIEGNTGFSDGQLRGHMRTRARRRWAWLPMVGRLASPGLFDPDVLDEDRRALEVLYRRSGYRDVRVTALLVEESGRAVVVVRVDEGARYVVRSIAFEGNAAVSDARLARLVRARTEAPLDPEALAADRARVREEYSAIGYPYSDVDAVFDEQAGRLTFRISEGKRVTVGTATVRFLDERPKTQPSVILRELLVSEGDVFNARRLAESRRRIYALGAFSTVRIESQGYAEGRDTLDLRVVVRERRAGSANISGGYSPSEGVRGTFEVVQRNWMGAARRIGTKLRLGTQGNRYEATFVEPWTLGARARTGLRVFRDDLEEQDNVVTNGFAVNLSRSFVQHNQAALQYRYQRFGVTESPKPDSAAIPAGGLPSLSAVGAFFQRDTRDNLFDPTRGWFHEVGTEVAGGPLGGGTELLKATLDTRYYVRFLGASWAMRTELGYGSSSARASAISSTERFRLGGSTTVRGYAERSLGRLDAYGNYRGDILLLANAEARVRVYRSAGVSLFADVGNTWERVAQIRDDPPKVSVGGGVRVDTPIGPARIEVGFPVSRLRGKPGGKQLWIALGNAF